MAYVFALPPQPTLPVLGSELLFPVRRIYCIGRNYAEHAREMGHDPDKEPPFFFQKNPDNIVTDGRFLYPPLSQDVQFEVELVVGLHAGGQNIAAERALACVYGYAVGLDMTRRDLQAAAKKLGRPWEVGKAFEASAPCSAITPAERIGHPRSGAIRLALNGELRQSGELTQMIWDVPSQIAVLSTYFELAAGDLIMTGTPAGVGPVTLGDRITATIDGVGSLEVVVV
jgi:fumarylpyruvate hydrolase